MVRASGFEPSQEEHSFCVCAHQTETHMTDMSPAGVRIGDGEGRNPLTYQNCFASPARLCSKERLSGCSPQDRIAGVPLG
jgi:hypothetical protein